jgi:hypothetical protein
MAKLPSVYELITTDMTNASAPMGSASTSSSSEFFMSPDSAMKSAEKHYNRNNDEKEKLKWKKTPRKSEWSTGDLRWVMYEIKPLKINP